MLQIILLCFTKITFLLVLLFKLLINIYSLLTHVYLSIIYKNKFPAKKL